MRPLSRTPAHLGFALGLVALLAACDRAGEDGKAADAPVADADGAGQRAADDVDPTAPARLGARPRAEAGNDDADGAFEALSLPPLRDAADLGKYVTTADSPYRIAQAFQFDAPVFAAPNASRKVVGLVRRNTRLAVDRWVPGEGCNRSWYALAGGGFVCSGEGFAVSSDPAALTEALRVGPPQVDTPLPYRYAKVKTPAPLYWRLPSEQELATGATAPIREQAQGAHFVAMDQTQTVGETTFHRTVRGFFIREQDLEQKPAPTMHGQRLASADDLPLAFVHADDATAIDPDTEAPIGPAEKFSRFAVDRITDGAKPRVVSAEGFALPREQVRIARVIDRPEEIPAGDQWIHLDLRQQVLVAYEGDGTPVLATLVSSGKEGFEPPLGVFRVHKKYTTVTMSGPDPDAGTYAVEQVPWTMYYWGSFALHGAYWHDEFGKVRSHGCTNIPPIDARFLFYWSKPELADGWHAEVGLKGPWVYFTKDTDEA